MTPVFKADAPGFIWLIVGIFWVVAQIAGAAAKKNQPPRPVEPDTEPGTTPGDPFAELMRKMAGMQPFEVPKPEYNNEPEYEEEQEAALAATERMPNIEPLRREVMGQTDLPPAPSEVAEIAIRPTMKAFRNTLPAMKLPSMTLRFQPLEKQTGKVPMLGPEQSESAFGVPKETTRRGVAKIIGPSDKQSLRRAMLGHIIFSKPKAFEQ